VRETVITGYADRLSVAPGETIEFKISSEQPGTYRADVVKLVNGDSNPAGPGFREMPGDKINGEYPARRQETDPGSYVLVDDGHALALAEAFTIHAFICPTLLDRAEQVVLGRYGQGRGYALALRDGRLALLLGAGGSCVAVEAPSRLYPSCWYSVAASYDGSTGAVRLFSRAVINSVNSLLSPAVPVGGEGVSETSVDVGIEACSSAFLIGGCWTGPASDRVDSHFNGRIDSPKVWTRVLTTEELDAVTLGAEPPPEGLAAAWHFAEGIGPDGVPDERVADAGPSGLHGRCVQFPARGVPGWNWKGREENFVHAPAEFGAIHFHEDDLEDCGWETDIRWTVPPDARSGVYALRLVQQESEDWIPFFVVPPSGSATARVLLLIPTASYLAYANEHLSAKAHSQALFGRTAVMDELTFLLYGHAEFGRSTYDIHTDGSGVHYSSALRPIINMRPRFRAPSGGPWQLPADLHLVAWLEDQGFAYDVATDRELHDEGAGLLGRYKVVLTGSHPEYYSANMLDAWEEYLGAGGRGMYLGGNGFYWIIGWHPEKKHLIEVRKGELGSRAWQARPGEYYLQSTGERSGLWRGRARAPQKNFGTGFTAQGFDASSYYVQMPDALDPRAAFIMEGIPPDEKIGDFGLVGGGAAGSELDRYDLALGTPPQALLLAYSEGHTDNYPRTSEELLSSWPAPGAVGTTDPNVRADIVYFTTRNGGAVFSTSSIAWCGSLLDNGCANNVSRMTGNVLRRFSEDEALPPLEPIESGRCRVVELG
jgi:N,N-dimethylformamidase